MMTTLMAMMRGAEERRRGGKEAGDAKEEEEQSSKCICFILWDFSLYLAMFTHILCVLTLLWALPTTGCSLASGGPSA